MQPADPQEPPIIRITIETNRVVEAEDAGHILEEVAKGFDRYVRGAGQRHLRLGIRRISPGSLVIDLIVFGWGGRDPQDPSAAARGFLAILARIAERGPGRSSPRADERMLGALLKPVTAGYAASASLGMLGETAMVRLDAGTAAGIAAVYGAAPRTPPRAPALSVDARPPPRRLDGGVGTALDVKGQWYVRLEGEEGVLNPLALDDGVAVEDGISYRFDGTWEGRRYRIMAARRIG